MEINEIAAKHLGSKQGDYSAYQNITEVREDFLVGVPRKLNRESIASMPDVMFGVDVWRGYEVSTLTNNGFPINFIAQITISSDSENLIESKSMKLYWNSFNMTHMGDTYEDVKAKVIERAQKDLSEVAKGAVVVNLADPSNMAAAIIMPQAFEDMARELLSEWKDIEFYNDNPSLLQERDSDRPFIFRSTSLRSNCRITKQPDFGDIVIRLYPNKTAPTPLSMLRYIISLRNEAHFHEEIVESVYSVLWEKYKPKSLSVEAFYTRRGGWDINPYRSSNPLSSVDNMNSSLIIQQPDFTQTEAEIKRTARQ